MMVCLLDGSLASTTQHPFGGKLTRPAQPDSTRPLDNDEHPINKTRPGTQNG